MVNIIGINGSLRDGSHTGRMVKTVLKGAKEAGADTQYIDLKRYNLPFCDGRKDSDYGPMVARLRKKIEQADAIVIGTPEYHGGYSGVLKNFLDLHPISTFRGKLVGLVGASGGRLGAEAAMNQLRVVFKNFEAFCHNTQTSATGADFKNGRLANDMLTKRLKTLGQELTTLATRFSQKAS